MQEVIARNPAASPAIQGTVDPRFEPMREAFARNFTEHDELGASVAVTLGGRLVVDLWGGWKDRARARPWTRDTRAPLWSGTKAVTGLCFAMVIDRGLARYDDRVSDYWPEFGAAGKTQVTIAQLLSHQAGLPGFLEPTTLEELLSTEIASARLAAQAPLWPPGEKCGYHGTSLGPIVSVLFQRIEGRPVRRFVAEEIAQPFGLDLSIGLDPELTEVAAETVRADAGMELGNFFKVDGKLSTSHTANPNLTPAQVASLNPPIDPHYANEPLWRAADQPAANGFGNARSLAQLYALALGHSLDGRRLARPEVLAEATRLRFEGMDEVKRVLARWAAGFQVNDGLYGPNPDTFYHAGLGGTFTLGDAVADLTVSYTQNRMSDLFERNPRRRGLVDAAYASLQA